MSRLCDVEQRPVQVGPVMGLSTTPVCSLKEAIQVLIDAPGVIIPELNYLVMYALEYAEEQEEENPEVAKLLSRDARACLHSYTIESPFCYKANAFMREPDRKRLTPFFPYLRLFFDGATALPRYQGKVLRGVRKGIKWAEFYTKGKKFRWWGFTSATKENKVLEDNGMFFGKEGDRTLFIIECSNGVPIHLFSRIPEEEILLLPGTQFEVIQRIQASKDLTIIDLKEVSPSFAWQFEKKEEVAVKPQVPLKKKPLVAVKKEPPEQKEEVVHRVVPIPAGLPKELVEVLTRHNKQDPTLTRVDLNGNRIGDDGAKALAEALKINRTVTVVGLTNNQIGDDGAKALAEALKINSTVTKVGLFSNQIGDNGAKALAEALKINRTVTGVYLYNNQIGDDGAKALAEALKINSTVTKVSLGQNRIGADGAKALAEALKINRTLTKVGLFSNQIGDNGAKALAEALKINRTVTGVYLYNNQIGDDGAKALAEALKINSTVTKVYLGNNQIGPDGAKALAEALKINSTVTVVYLNSNQIGDNGAKALQPFVDSGIVNL